MSKAPSNVIIGAGKVGSSLANAFAQHGVPVKLIDKNQDRQIDALTTAKLVLLTVQDERIEDTCNAIAPYLTPNIIVAHCSGALGCDVLRAASAAKCLTACAHPLNSFPSKQAAIDPIAKHAHGTTCFLSGDQTAIQTLKILFEKIGFNTAYLNEKDKIFYHAACVFACNYLTSLAELSLNAAERAGLNREEFWQAVQPLISTTLNNISELGTVRALSGPIARGDADTVTKHLMSFSGKSDLTHQAYNVLGRQALELAKHRGELSCEQLLRIEELLQ